MEFYTDYFSICDVRNIAVGAVASGLFSLVFQKQAACDNLNVLDVNLISQSLKKNLYAFSRGVLIFFRLLIQLLRDRDVCLGWP